MKDVCVRACVCLSVTREGERERKREKGENDAGNSRGFAALALAFHTWSTAGLVYPWICAEVQLIIEYGLFIGHHWAVSPVDEESIDLLTSHCFKH